MISLVIIDEQLKQLHAFIESLDTMNVEEILSEYMQLVAPRFAEEEVIQKNQSLIKELHDLKKTYSTKMSSDEFSWILCQYLFIEMRNVLIFEKARVLNINPQLYKKEMDFLYKGKTK